MATPDHTPQGRGYDSSLGYFCHCNDYWNENCGAGLVDLWDTDRLVPSMSHPLRFLFFCLLEETVIVCADPLRRGVGAPQPCSLELTASYLCHFMLTCVHSDDSSYRRRPAFGQNGSCTMFVNGSSNCVAPGTDAHYTIGPEIEYEEHKFVARVLSVIEQHDPETP